ncbi:MAG: hypothetical protein ABFR62_07275 [Bacteroidota bacterium]
MYNNIPNIDYLNLSIILIIDTIIAGTIAYKQHKEQGYNFGKQFIQVWIGVTGVSFIILKFF